MDERLFRAMRFPTQSVHLEAPLCPANPAGSAEHRGAERAGGGQRAERAAVAGGQPRGAQAGGGAHAEGGAVQRAVRHAFLGNALI